MRLLKLEVFPGHSEAIWGGASYGWSLTFENRLPEGAGRVDLFLETLDYELQFSASQTGKRCAFGTVLMTEYTHEANLVVGKKCPKHVSDCSEYVGGDRRAEIDVDQD